MPSCSVGKEGGCVAALVPLCVTGWCLGEEERILVVVGRRRKRKKQGVGEVSCVSILGRSRQSLGLSGVLGERGGPIEGGGKQIGVNDGSGREEINQGEEKGKG